MTCQTAHDVFNQAFLAGTPDIAAEILDLSYSMPMWLSELWELKPWTATDTVMQQLVFRGSLPEVERGFDKWKKLASSAGCSPCTNDCSYNTTTFDGHGFERRLVSLMRREFETPEYCVNEIRSSLEFEQTFAKIIEDIQKQVSFFKEYNIGLNFLTGIAKKLIVDGGGIKGNSQDPYSYRPLGTAVLSKLNFRMLSKIYEGLRRRSDVIPFDLQNGMPLYAISASDELMDDLFIADPNARADLRFSSGVDALLTRYNFMSSVRGQFLNAPLLYPRRFEYLSTGWEEIFPFVNGLPAEIGSFSDLNPDWENASYEEVLVYGKSPFTVYYRDQLTTIGSGTSFGPEPTFMNTWLWINNQTDCDMFRRVGKYATSIEMALAPQWSGGVYGIMVPRPSASSVVEYYVDDATVPSSSESTNVVPDVGLPCQLITAAIQKPTDPTRWYLTFSSALATAVNSTVNLAIDSGGFLVGTVQSKSTDNLNVEMSFPAGTVFGNCKRFVSVYCTTTASCTSDVISTCECRSGVVGSFGLILEEPIRAVTTGEIIYGYMGDGTVQHLSIVSVDQLNNVWNVQYAVGSGPTSDPTQPTLTPADNLGVNCDRGGVLRVCVPTSSDATCTACS